jgi:plasmid maintenance system antidote protein VapI
MRSKPGGTSATDLAEMMGTSDNWARVILNDLFNLGQIKMARKENRAVIYEIAEMSLLPVLRFKSGDVPPTVLVEHFRNGGVSSKDLAAALKINVTIVDALIKFYSNRIDEAISLSTGNTVNKERATEARISQRDVLQAIQELYDVIEQNVMHSNWFDPDVLARMPRSAKWSGRLAPVGGSDA